MKITLAMITYNEEDRLAPALESARCVADEIVVIDSLSRDRTCEIAASFGARVILRPFVDYASQKNAALEAASHEWVLNLDADERLDSELAGQILVLKNKGEPAVDGFRIRRKARYLGRWIHHSGWYPEKKLRLFRKEMAHWQGRVHERLELAGRCGELTGHILHYTYRDIGDHLDRINRYTGMQAQDMATSNRKLLLLRGLLLSPITFLRHYVWRLGFLDGFPGLVIALVSSWGTMLKHLKAAAIRKTTKKRNRPGRAPCQNRIEGL